MHEIPATDPGKVIDWSKTSDDYAKYRPGPPPSFYKKLQALDIGLPGQKILDLGTGTGVLGRNFAKQEAIVSGTDILPAQIEVAKRLSKGENLEIDFKVAPAEDQPYSDHQFDVITACQCWLYFDKNRIIKEVKRLLKSTGVLVTCHLSWLPREDKIAKKTEELVLKFNPHWTAGNFSGTIPPFPKWAEESFKLRGMFYYDEQILFTRDTWRGRIRACRGVGAELSQDEVNNFDQALDQLLKNLADDEFTVLHRMDAHILEPL